ncbi:MAG: L-lactate permease [Chloroflexi bacterium]|nr:L-lactate permease [Chloroflexota bacterium]
MPTILASAPILLILVLMVGFRWGAARAGAAGYLSALAIAIAFFGADADVLAYAHAKALLLSLDVLYIIWAAFLLYRVADEAGAIRTIGAALPRLTADKGMQAMLIGWVFASFLQGTGGFGVPVAVTAPLLVGLGFSPLTAVVIPTIGHGWAVTFGSLGSSFNALMSATGMDAATLSPWAALFLGLAALPTGWMVLHAADGWAGVRRLAGKALVIGAVMGGVQYLVAAIGGLWNIGAFAGGLAGLVVSVPLARWGEAGPKSGKGIAAKPLLVALSAYLVLIILTAVILLVPPIKNTLGQIAVKIQFPETVTRLGHITPAGTNKPIRVFTHAGAILLYASLAAYAIYLRAGLYTPGAGRRIVSSTVRKMMTSSLSIAEMVAMALVMQQSGMTEALARGLANSVGAAFPVVAPWIGAVGAFMTGSNTNSNVVFAALQMRTAELLGYAAPVILAAQTAGAALASVVAPTKVVVGASTAGMDGKEGLVMRAVIGYIGLLVLFVSLLTAFAAWIWYG